MIFTFTRVLIHGYRHVWLLAFSVILATGKKCPVMYAAEESSLEFRYCYLMAKCSELRSLLLYMIAIIAMTLCSCRHDWCNHPPFTILEFPNHSHIILLNLSHCFKKTLIFTIVILHQDNASIKNDMWQSVRDLNAEKRYIVAPIIRFTQIKCMCLQVTRSNYGIPFYFVDWNGRRSKISQQQPAFS